MRKLKYALIFILFFLGADFCLASSSFIESISKVRKSDGYTFKINYETTQEWTDGLILKLFCIFSKGAELSFTSSGYNNLKKGWHKTEIKIPDVYRDRHGYIKDYRVEMYSNGILVSIKSM
ncbi:MAG TPA: hypothetical protein DCY56_00675 [Candidatus Omnitrophica bacterium]|nr:hypothetical protein [Candidatus Omnitrophota bacterium]